MYLTKSLVLTVHWTPNIYLKQLQTFTETYKCWIFDVCCKKHFLTTRKLWNHQNTCNLHGFERKPSFVDPPLGVFLGPHWGIKAAQKRRRSDFDKVSPADWVKSWFLKDVISKITVFGIPGRPETDFGTLLHKIWAFETWITWCMVWNTKKRPKKVMRLLGA